MPRHRYFLTDFVNIQRQSFFDLLEKGLIEEFSKRNPITNLKRDLEFVFYPEYYILTRPEYTPQEAILKNKSYTSKLFVPGQLTDIKKQKAVLKWFYIGNIPLMTKRGHFILNGAARVIVNQILRSPGIYYQQKIYENYQEKWSQKPDDTYKRFYADLICMRGTWLRIEIDKEKNIWAQMKKGPKIPIYWFLLAMGLSEKKIFKSITDSFRLLGNLKTTKNLPDSSLMVDNINNLAGDSSLNVPLTNKTTTNANAKGKNEGVNTRTVKESKQNRKYAYLKSPPEAWAEIYKLLSQNTLKKSKQGESKKESTTAKNISSSDSGFSEIGKYVTPKSNFMDRNSKRQNLVISGLAGSYLSEPRIKKDKSLLVIDKDKSSSNVTEEGRKWFYNKFMNPRSYNLGKQGRFSFNKKLCLNVSSNQMTLTGLDVLYATDYLIKVEKGLFKTDDIDHLKNRRVRTSGELIQIQIGVGLVRLEKSIRENLNKLNLTYNDSPVSSKVTATGSAAVNTLRSVKKNDLILNQREIGQQNTIESPPQKYKPNNIFKNNSTSPFYSPFDESFSRLTSTPSDSDFAHTKQTKDANVTSINTNLGFEAGSSNQKHSTSLIGLRFSMQEDTDLNRLSVAMPKEKIKIKGRVLNKSDHSILMNFVNSKAFNSAIREFFGTSPLSQFMDQINPLAELTHKRRLSSMGPGGVTRDTATLAIRGIHPTHYGRICPIETPEGKNTGLVNSMTTYARVNENGLIESPFYRVYKGQVQRKVGMYFFSAEQEEQIRLAAADLSTSSVGFLPKSFIPVRIAEDFTKIPRGEVQYVGVSPLQMISVATSLIPFLEHDDANRALMGSNMQRQAVPLIKPERPIVGTGLEARTVSDSGHAIIAKTSGFVTYVSSQKIVIYSFCN